MWTIPGPTCILLGNEKHGVSAAAADLADAHVVIPMLGMVQSLNVSVAAAVILVRGAAAAPQGGVLRRAPAETRRSGNGWRSAICTPVRRRSSRELGQAFPGVGRRRRHRGAGRTKRYGNRGLR